MNANNVVLDCNDHAITHTAGGFAGVHVANRQNVTVRNCAISGFARGIDPLRGGESAAPRVPSRGRREM